LITSFLKAFTISDGCWEWERSTNNSGYGTISIAGGTWLVHRLMYTLHYGVFPGGKCVMHSCDNRVCVNPSHLKLGTYSENGKDCVIKGRHHETKKTHCAKGHTFKKDNLYPTKTGKRRCKKCSKISEAKRRAKKRALEAPTKSG